MTTFSLRQAATEAGTSKSTILRAIQSGRLSAARTDEGGYAIDPSELFRVYPPKPADNGADQEMTRSAVQSAPADEPLQNVELRIRNAELEANLKALQAIVELERERVRERDRRIEEVRADGQAWRAQAERLALAPPKPAEPPAVIALPGPAPEPAPAPKRSWWPFRRTA